MFNELGESLIKTEFLDAVSYIKHRNSPILSKNN